MTYDLIKISALPETTPDDSQDIVIGDGDYAKRINYGDVKADMVGTSPTYTTDTEPYLMRQTAHVGVVGKCALNKLVGGSLGWNQVLSQSGLSNGTVGGITLVKNSNGSVTLTGARTGENVNFNCDYVANTIKYQTGHVYYLSWSSVNGIGLQIIMESDVGADSLNKNRLIKVAATASTRSWARIRIGTPMNANIGTVTYFPQILDITQMFGATIADYAANLENTYGTGIAWLSKYIDLGTYHAFDAGSIQSVQVTAHVTTGFNQWDEQWENSRYRSDTGGKLALANAIGTKNPVRVIPESAYYFKVASNSRDHNLAVFQYDANGNFLSDIGQKIVTANSNNPLTMSPKTCYVNFYWETSATIATYDNTFCINISKPTGTPKNGDYVPYSGHTYSLGSDTLRGIPQLVSNKLAFDGDEKAPDGTITRKYGYVDLGSLTWTYASSSGRSFFTALTTTITPSPKLPLDNSYAFNAIIAGYDAAPMTAIFRDRNFGADASVSGNRLLICDNRYTTAAAFTSAVTGQYMVYELATASTESSTAYQKVQTIDADGTESFTTSSPVPVGHETQTADNVLAALEWLGE